MKRAKQNSVSRQQLESLLQQVLVPVEPDIRFVRKLRARLVTYRGSRIGPIWALAFGVGVATVITVASLGLTLRVILALLGVLGSVSRRRAESGSQAGLATEA
jgi:hypothetical protein